MTNSSLQVSLCAQTSLKGLVHAWLKGSCHSTDTARPQPELLPQLPTAQWQFQARFSDSGCYQARRDQETSLEERPRPQPELWPPSAVEAMFSSLAFPWSHVQGPCPWSHVRKVPCGAFLNSEGPNLSCLPLLKESKSILTCFQVYQIYKNCRPQMFIHHFLEE